VTNNMANNNNEQGDGSTSSMMNTIIMPLGRWNRVLAEVGHYERVPLGATPVYKILQSALVSWILQ
jgi:hypothetical protein